jgi:hypothetical protein
VSFLLPDTAALDDRLRPGLLSPPRDVVHT